MMGIQTRAISMLAVSIPYSSTVMARFGYTDRDTFPHLPRASKDHFTIGLASDFSMVSCCYEILTVNWRVVPICQVFGIPFIFA